MYIWFQNLPQGLKPLIPILQDLKTYLTPNINPNTATEMAELLSRNCKLLAENAIDEFSQVDNGKMKPFQRDDSFSQYTSQPMDMKYNCNPNITRKKSAPLAIDYHNVEKPVSNQGNTRHTINVDEV